MFTTENEALYVLAFTYIICEKTSSLLSKTSLSCFVVVGKAYSPSCLMRPSSKIQIIKFGCLKYSFGHYYSYKFSLSSTSLDCFTLVHAFSYVLMFKNTLKSDLSTESLM